MRIHKKSFYSSSHVLLSIAVSAIAVLSACVPQAERQAVSGPPPAAPVVYDANAFDVFQITFQAVTQAPGVPGWESEEMIGDIFGVGGTVFTTTFGNSGSWSIRQSDRAAGFIRAETINRGVINPPSLEPDPEIEHAVTVAISGPDETGPTQVIVNVSTIRSTFLIDYIYAALDQNFDRVE